MTQPHATLKTFKVLSHLGKGGYGNVYLVRKKGGLDDGSLYAMKIMEKPDDALSLQDSITERKVHEKVSNIPFLVGLHYACQTEMRLYLIIDYYEGGTMTNLLRQKGPFTEDQARIYIAEVVLAIEHLHKMRVIHRDLKPDNILLDARGHVAVADYGISKTFRSPKKAKRTYSFCGTREYMAPEVIRSKGYGLAADWWSVGVLAYEMVKGVKPFKYNKDCSDCTLFSKILNCKPVMPRSASKDMRDLITRLLEKQPRYRLCTGKRDAKEIKTHRFFRDINWEDVKNKVIPMPFVPVFDHGINNTIQEYSILEPPISEMERGKTVKGYTFPPPEFIPNGNSSRSSSQCSDTNAEPMAKRNIIKRQPKRNIPNRIPEPAIKAGPSKAMPCKQKRKPSFKQAVPPCKKHKYGRSPHDTEDVTTSET
ncbi:ribosomal protein S6 kinase alpha-5-like [Zootermopsis nevadensis]|uniref:non-specific serine/threonine protein kinase n=1 Tax=Zootermopsis nevadensis TaxID=136037 RepID=A0A067RI04_ZOONE|nr:ribosomal protein S6 kinase alpha-5-like [Zootermopsis nevadensis]XP_021918814.1 ribosomal protein S6 kinase alpha-5-like [Zootermopsis nevadensis]KDR20026.1 Ribosomal protein S6 kinase alpha-5 [Zootermopsis nevadensis]